MKKKFLWLGVSFLLVAALVLTACGPAVPGEQEEEEEEEEEVVPQHGGTLTAFWPSAKFQMSEPASPDIGDGYWAPTQWLAPVQDTPFIGDFVKYGPKGTGAFAFDLAGYNPEEFMMGALIESWEVSPEQTVWHVRQGVYWQADHVDFMETREVVAEDIVADLLYFREAPGGVSLREWSGDIYATDKYTLVIEFAKYDPIWFYIIGYEDRALIEPPETRAAGADRYANQVGTGPFVIEEYAIGSHIKYVRNPNWWLSQVRPCVIDGVEYEVPFVDELILPIIPDVGTSIAALRTGLIDYYPYVDPEYWDHLDEAAPWLVAKKFADAYSITIALKSDEPPFNDRNVRRAMMIGTNLTAYTELIGVGPLPELAHNFPIWPGHSEAFFTPMEKLPAETQLLFDYDPELARQMLADAGYPNGFTTTYTSTSRDIELDYGALIVNQWAEIGVTVEHNVVDGATYSRAQYEGEYEGVLWDDLETGNPAGGLDRLLKTDAVLNSANWSDAHFDGLIDQASAAAKVGDFDEQNRLIKEAAVYGLNEVAYIPVAPRMTRFSWVPWIMNYHGETNTVDRQQYYNSLAYAWIDQDMKAEMGY